MALTVQATNGIDPARYGIAPLPGTRSFADEKTGQLVRGGAANYVPYFSRGWLGDRDRAE